ncbi:hypothetical protein BLNAU_11545 [Blattamonas nauphoetae]|uniref:Uncharacterized protein n=1 Tax=Blattamonas nauphoetae TaxID=2049346 RepID=A0ABQ9XSI6_9EUKA|nr:hypothetical protein BLNAU_11545 [Blattamonas nauphoetae]
MNLLMELDNDQMEVLQEQFESQEVEVHNFVELMEEHLPNNYFDIPFVRNLVNLFEEIDVNGDGGMDWDVCSSQVITPISLTLDQGINGFHYRIYRERVTNFKISPDRMSSLLPISDLFQFNHVADVHLTDMVIRTQYSPASKKLYCCEEHTNNVIVVEASSGEHIQTLRGHTGVVLSCDFIDELDLLVTSSMDGTISLWKNDTCECIFFTTTATKTSDYVVQSFLKWDPVSQQLISGGMNGRIICWKVKLTPQPSVCFMFPHRPSSDGAGACPLRARCCAPLVHSPVRSSEQRQRHTPLQRLLSVPVEPSQTVQPALPVWFRQLPLSEVGSRVSLGSLPTAPPAIDPTAVQRTG